MKPKIALLDDDPRMGRVLAMVLESLDAEIETFEDPRLFLAAFRDEARRFDLLITDLKMPHLDGLQVLDEVKRIDEEVPVILITAHGTVSTAVSALKRGAFDFVLKPFDNDTCRAQAWRALEMTRLSRENRALRAALTARHLDASPVVIHSPLTERAFSPASRAAKSAASVLIQGESGTGKEVLARHIHAHSDRVAAPFVAVNCAAFSEGLLESELFGHRKGAFTGASSDHEGLFQRADGGTLFLDEIGEVSSSFQVKLLRVLQERVVQPVGGSGESMKVDVRIVAATNKELSREVAQDRFREDLYYRLAVIPITLPPLRDRVDEILPLARHFLLKYRRLANRALTGWSEQVERYLLTHPWPGNVRELENTIERGVIMASGEQIELEDLLLDERRLSAASQAIDAETLSLEAYLEQMTRRHLLYVLERCEGKKQEAAERLGIDRTTLYRLLKRHGIS